MTSCHQCGADIRWAELDNMPVAEAENLKITLNGRIPLDAHPTYKGTNRFREVSYNPLRVEPVGDNEEVAAYALHTHE